MKDGSCFAKPIDYVLCLRNWKKSQTLLSVSSVLPKEALIAKLLKKLDRVLVIIPLLLGF
jgi:hypothetical protein